MLPKMIEIGGPYGKFKTEIVDQDGQSVATVITSKIKDRIIVPDDRGETVLREMIHRWNSYGLLNPINKKEAGRNESRRVDRDLGSV